MRAGKLHDKDHGSDDANIAAYGQAQPPVINLEEVNKAKVPMHLVIAKHDLLVKTKFSKRVIETLKESLIDYQYVDGGHNIFMIAKSVNHWTDRLLVHLSNYNKI